MAKVAALGLDAAEWTFIEDLLARGVMPHLAQLRERSAVARLGNVTAYRSELPWTQFATGHDARNLGYWGTVAFDPETYRATAAGALDAKPFWARPGLRSLVFDVPHTVLRDDVDGTQVTAWGAHSPEYPRASRPAGVLADIDARIGRHPAFANDSDPGWYSAEYLENLAGALRLGAHRRIDAVESLVASGDYDFVVTTMSEAHSGGHHLWHGVDPAHPLARTGTAEIARHHMISVYRSLDDCIGRFVRLFGDDTAVVVFSLHGMQTNANDLPSMVLLPELLHRDRFGARILRDPDQRAWRAAGMPPVVPPGDRTWIGLMAERFADSRAASVRNAVKRALPRRVLHPVRRALGRPGDRLGPLATPIPPEDRRDRDALTLGAREPDYQIVWRYHEHWPRMRAFALPTFSDGHVRINVRGRERDGMVAPDDFAVACEEVVQLVSECRDPRTGAPVLADAIRTRARPGDDGPAADLVLLWAGCADAFEHPRVGTIGPFPFCRTGEHSSNGFAMVAGPNVEPGDVGKRSAFDLTPTLLALLGEEHGEELAGRPFPIAVRT